MKEKHESSHRAESERHMRRSTHANPWMYVSILLGVLLVVSIAANGFILFAAMHGVAPAAQPAAQPTAPAQQPTAPTAPTRVNFKLPSYAIAEGTGKAPINIIEFGDYQCPFCERFFSQTEPSITKDYVDTGKVNFYFLDFAFLGPDSTTLSEGAWCAADQGLYYKYHDYMYSHQQQENSGWATAAKVKAMAANIPGLNTATFNSCLDSGKYASRVSQLQQLGQSAGVSGTPSMLIGNAQKGYQLIVGAIPYATIKQTIDSELSN